MKPGTRERHAELVNGNVHSGHCFCGPVIWSRLTAVRPAMGIGRYLL